MAVRDWTRCGCATREEVGRTGRTSARPRAWTLSEGDGSKQVDVEYRDVAGNSEQYADSIGLDTTAPGVALTAVAQGTVVELEWSASDAGAGLDGCELVYQEGEGSWQALSTSCSGTDTFTPTLPRVWYTFHLTATDEVSNTAVATATASVRDCTKYYYLGAQRVAMRDADDDTFWLHGDHPGQHVADHGRSWGRRREAVVLSVR